MIIKEDVHTFKHAQDADSLYIKTGDGVFCLSSWRYGLSCNKWEGARWKSSPTPCEWSLPKRDMALRPYSYFGSFVLQIPEEYRAIAASFTSAQIPILRLLRLSPHAGQLASSVPFLFWFLAIAWDKGKMSGRSVQECLLLPPVEMVAKVCGEPEGAPAITLTQLRKISMHGLGLEQWEYFTRLVQAKLFQYVRHWPNIDLDRLHKCHKGLQELGEDALESWLLERILKNRPARVWSQAIEDSKTIVMLAKELHNEELLDKVMLCRNLDDLQALRCRTEDFYNEQLRAQYFPVPAFKGNENIEHIANSNELYAEGKQMHHCVFDYLDEALEGTAVFYRVLAPKRGTLLLLYKSPNRYKSTLWRSEFLLAYNEEPDDLTKCAVFAELISAGVRHDNAIPVWLEGTEHIIPLTDISSVITEQRECGLALPDDFWLPGRPDISIYKVLFPHRAILMLVRPKDSNTLLPKAVIAIKNRGPLCSDNLCVYAETVAYIRRWLFAELARQDAAALECRKMHQTSCAQTLVGL